MLFLPTRKKPDAVPEYIHGVRVRRNMRARRLALRVDTARGDVVLVWPRRASLASATAFVAENMAWVEKQRRQMPPRADFADGIVITVGGVPCRIAHSTARGVTRIENGCLVVHGGIAHLPRRVRDYLRQTALEQLTALTHEKSAALGLPPAAVRVADPKTRWGSCGPDGKIMYSWRLILAPRDVMDYVVAHEVAHRVHLNHGRKFWTLCASLCDDAATARRWLRDRGQELMTFR